MIASRINRELGRLAGTALCLAFMLMTTGCASNRSASSSFASVTIANHSLEEIRGMTIKTFKEVGYKYYQDPTADSLTFEKEGSRQNAVNYAGIDATMNGAVAVNRVVVDTLSLDDGSYSLGCQAYIVTNEGDSTFENDHPLANFRSGPYQDILDQVRDGLKKSP